jgi:hypothetical protein
MKTLEDIREGDARARGLIDIARAQAEGKDRAGAEKSLSTAAETATTLPAEEKAELLDEIGAVRGSLQLAAGDVAGALESAMAVKSFRTRSGLLLEVGRTQLKAGDRKAARATFERAMKAADSYPEAGENEGGVITLVPVWALIKGSVVNRVAAAATEAGGEAEARTWAAAQKSPFVRVMAQIGIAAGTKKAAR